MKPHVRRVHRHKVTQPLDQSYRLIALTQGQNAIVDMSDFEWLSQWNWHARWSKTSKSFYASTNHEGHMVSMHNLLSPPGMGRENDHKNHNTLDNRRDNLRKCTRQQNLMNRRIQRNNTSGFKGVYWDKKNSCWMGFVRANGKLRYLGRFNYAEDAARAYDKAATEYHGEFAMTNC